MSFFDPIPLPEGKVTRIFSLPPIPKDPLDKKHREALSRGNIERHRRERERDCNIIHHILSRPMTVLDISRSVGRCAKTVLRCLREMEREGRAMRCTAPLTGRRGSRGRGWIRL